MEYQLDGIGLAPFRLLSTELVTELTGHSLEATNVSGFRCPPAASPVNLRWPEFLGGETWSGLILLDCLYVSESDQKSWTSDRLQSYVNEKLEHEVTARGNNKKRLDAVAQKSKINEKEIAEENKKLLEGAPQYLIIATNLPRPVVEKLNHEGVRRELLRHAEQLHLRGWKFWDRTTFWHMLDAAKAARRKHLAELAPKNILDQLHNYNVGVPERLQELFKLQMINELKAEQWIHLSQVGNSDVAKLDLYRVGIDLPVKEESKSAARLVIEAADAASPFKRSNATANVLLLGGPGQGKSTIAQLIGQSYRVALLEGTLNPDHPTYPLAIALRKGFRESGIPLPNYKRWPVRIDLANYVDSAVNYRQTSLVAYIAEQLDRRASGMSGPRVRTWLGAWPWILILDGFDEVVSVTGRETLMEQLDNFMGEVELADADVFVLATTRPQGYAGEFARHGYRNLELAPLEVPRAVEYAVKLAEARHVDDPDMRERVIERLNAAAEDRFTARLMRSPLQVTIMSFLLEARERVPRARYELFDAYYEAIYSRESAKPGPLPQLLEKRRNDINSLHNWLGLQLQVNSETAGDLDASIPAEELRLSAIRRLEEEGYDSRKATELAGEIINVVTRRLVLIVPKKLEDVGFEVRSLQEFFAARSVASGTDSDILERLNTTIEPIHWRNTWLFAAGKMFLEREHIRRGIVGLLSEIDNKDLMRMVVAPGADLALDLLEDDVASNSPRLQRMLYRHALELVKYPPDEDLRRRVSVLFQLAANDNYLALLMEQAIDQAMGGTAAQLQAAQTLLAVADQGASPLAFKFRPRLRDIERMIRASIPARQDNRRVLKEILASAIENAPLSQSEQGLAEEFLVDFTKDPDLSDADTGDQISAAPSRRLLDECLKSEPVASVLAGAVISAAQVSTTVGSELRNLLRSWLQRRAAGTGLLDSTCEL